MEEKEEEIRWKASEKQEITGELFGITNRSCVICHELREEAGISES